MGCSSSGSTRDSAVQDQIDDAIADAVLAARATMAFVDLPPFGNDGRETFAQAEPTVWAAPVSAVLAKTVDR